MTKITGLNDLPSMPPKDYLDNIQYSPYWNLAWKICEEKWNVDDPNILHILLAMHEIGHVAEKINPKEK